MLKQKKIKKHSILIKLSYFILSICIITILATCAVAKQFKIPAPIPDDRNNIPQPKTQKIHVYGEYFDKQFTLQAEQTFDLSRQLRNLFNKRKQAKNIDAFGEVPNSSWFTNRNAQSPMSLEEIKHGPNKSAGPDTSDFWIITRAKAEGVTPGFSIKDKQGKNYVIKFDPPGYAELASGAEVVSTKLFYALGYNVPENYITYFHPHILKLGDKVKFTDYKGHKRYMKEDDLAEILKKIQYLPDGRIRALASKYIPGKPIGPFKYKGIRKDDPNDLLPHQYRRELRGLRIIAAWLNHFDTKDGNTLDSYVTENGASYVKHFLIDFGATLGSASHGPNHLWRGYQNDFDPHVVAVNALTMGLYVRPWEKQPGVKYLSVGIYESKLFHPHKYKPQVPNPAFENMTYLDAYWATKNIMSFTDEQLKAIVAQGKYSNPEAEVYLYRTLIKRRDKIGRYYFSKITPIDKFEIKQLNGGEKILFFQDLAVEAGLETAEQTLYQYELKCNSVLVQKLQFSGKKTIIELPAEKNLKNQLFKQSSTSAKLNWEYKIQSKRQSQQKWSKCIKIYMKSDNYFEKFELIGIER